MKSPPIALVFAVAAVAGAASAQSCPSVDYAQVKDNASSSAGRISLRYEYCIADNHSRGAATERARTECDSAKRKIYDALIAVGDNDGARFALAGCKGPAPDAELPAKK